AKPTHVCCIGAGYVGGPTSAVMALKCPEIQFTVVDVDDTRIAAWNSDKLPVYEPGLDDIVYGQRGVNLHFSTDIDQAIVDADIIMIAVNTPPQQQPGCSRLGAATDLRSVEECARRIARVSQHSNPIVVEKSTVPCRTGELIANILRDNSHSHVNFTVLSNPEFLSEGTAIQDLLHPDRVIIGGYGNCSHAENALKAMYSHWVPKERILTMDLWSAELTKLASNALLAQRISSINSISAVCEAVGADISSVAQGCGLDSRIGSQFLRASVGFGGSCFHKDILSLIWLSSSLGLHDVAEYWNQVLLMNGSQMMRFVNNILQAFDGNMLGIRIAVLGFAYKADTADTRNTPAAFVCQQLLNKGANLSIYDPKVPGQHIRELLQIDSSEQGEISRLSVCQSAYMAATSSHAVVVLTPCKRINVFWDVGYIEGSRDGYYIRRYIGVNGTSPIPPIYATQGDNLELTIHNSLDVPTSIHAHGIYQNSTSYLDGTGMVSQCGILPGKSFTYRINTQQAGTFLLYGSNNHQEADGLRTALVIRSLNPRFDYDEDMLFTLEDWYPKTFHQKMGNINKPGVVFPPPPNYATGLVNGHNGNLTRPIRFSPGKKYRLNVASMAVTMWFKFNIPGHKLTVIEADGVETEPHTVDGLDLGPKQRYSVLVNAKKSSEFNYLYNATLYANFIPKWPGMNPRYYTGIVEYKKGVPVKSHSLPDDEQLEWSDETKLLASDHQPPLEPVDRQIELSAELFKAADGSSYFVLDKLPFATSKIPTLYSAMTMGSLAQNGTIYGPQANAHVLKHLEVVQVTIHNPSELYRSFHLHGHSFQVIAYGPAKNIPDDVKRPVRKTTKWPLRRDTITVASYESVAIRFKADNPGVWLLRCAMSTHYYLGLAMTFIEAPEILQQRQKIPFELQHICKQQNIGIHGNAAGNSGFNLTGLPPPPIRVINNS
ncbi:hypothetical protein IWW36_003925, partial [Coemansia brasiliensis]